MRDMQELGGLTFEVRTGSQNAVVSQIRDEVRAIVPGWKLPVYGHLMSKWIISAAGAPSFDAGWHLTAPGGAVVGMFGLYGLARSATVVRKTNDIGIRMALGAARNDVVWMILRETLLLIVIGICISLPVALVSTHLLASMLFGVKPDDPVSILAAILVMVGVALVAGMLACRRRPGLTRSP